MLDWIAGFLGGILYPLFSIIFVCIDGLQGLFFALAGIGDLRFGAANNGGVGTPIGSGNTGAENDTGLIYFLFNHALVRNLLLSIMLLALFLVIIFTVMAFIKNAYAAKQKGWKEIVGNAIKGLGNFILLPVLCLLGVWLANILLQAINGATSGGGATQMSRKLFIASAYNANSCRSMSDSEAEEFFFRRLDDLKSSGANYLDGSEVDWNSFQKGRTADYYADRIDHIYAETNISIYEWVTVEVGYSLFQINYLILIVGGVFMLKALGTLAFGMVKRIFLLLILFVVSPGICALYPLDEGKAVQGWAGEVKKNILSAHGAVAAINIFFALLPLIDNIHFGGGAGFWGGAGSWLLGFAFVNDILQLFILTVGLMCVTEFTGLLSGFIGGADAYGSSKGQLKAATTSITKRVMAGAGIFALAKAASHQRKGAWEKTKGVLGSLKDQTLGAVQKETGLDISSTIKTYKDENDKLLEKNTKKEAEKEFKQRYENSWFKDNQGNIDYSKLEEMKNQAAVTGVDDKVVMKTFMQNVGKDLSNLSDLREVLRGFNAYTKEQEKIKMERASSYSAHGAEFERKLEGAKVEIIAQETKIQSAESTFNAASVAKDKSAADLQSFVDGSKNAKNQTQRSQALNAEMQRKIDEGDFTAIKTRGLGSAEKRIANEFNKKLEEAAKKLEEFKTSEDKLNLEKDKQQSNIEKLNNTLSEIGEEFSTVKTIVSNFGGTANKSAAQLEDLIKQVRKDIRS